MPTRAPLVLSAALLACTPRPTAVLSDPETTSPDLQSPESTTTDDSKGPEARWVDLSIEAEFGCAVERGGAVYCWGRGPAAQMGLRELPEQPKTDAMMYGDRKWGPPSRLEIIDDARRISTANSRACAIVADGRVRCWGAVRWGSQHVYDVAGITDAVELQIGDGESCVMAERGELWCWGTEDYGVPQTRLVGAVAMAVSDNLACGLTEQGDVSCWGQGVADWHRYDIQFKQAQAPGFNPQAPRPEPDPDSLPDVLEIGRFRGAVDIALSGWNNLCVLQRDGSVRCSTQDVFSLLGGQKLEMREVEGLRGVTSLAATRSHSCATTQSGAAMCWGRNVYGQLGDGTSTAREAAAPVADLDDVLRVAVTENTSCATTRDDRLLCWGYDLGEAIGHEERHVNTVADLRASSIAAYGRTTCAVDDAKALRCWGSDMLEQIGIAAAARRPSFAAASRSPSSRPSAGSSRPPPCRRPRCAAASSTAAARSAASASSTPGTTALPRRESCTRSAGSETRSRCRARPTTTACCTSLARSAAGSRGPRASGATTGACRWPTTTRPRASRTWA